MQLYEWTELLRWDIEERDEKIKELEADYKRLLDSYTMQEQDLFNVNRKQEIKRMSNEKTDAEV